MASNQSIPFLEDRSDAARRVVIRRLRRAPYRCVTIRGPRRLCWACSRESPFYQLSDWPSPLGRGDAVGAGRKLPAPPPGDVPDGRGCVCSDVARRVAFRGPHRNTIPALPPNHIPLKFPFPRMATALFALKHPLAEQILQSLRSYGCMATVIKNQ